MARATGLVYWFHPAVHFASRSLRQARELATDAAVLETGVEPALYARQLFNVASGNVPRGNSFGVPMAGSQDFEQRIEKILERGALSPMNRTTRSLRANVVRLMILGSFLLLAGFSIQLTFANQQETAQATDSEFPMEVADEDVTGSDFYTRVAQTRRRSPFDGSETIAITRSRVSTVA